MSYFSSDSFIIAMLVITFSVPPPFLRCAERFSAGGPAGSSKARQHRRLPFGEACCVKELGDLPADALEIPFSAKLEELISLRL